MVIQMNNETIAKLSEIKRSLLMNESILLEIKKLLGFDATYTHFDEDIIVAINAAIGTLHQIGLGDFDSMPLIVVDDSAKWSDLLENNSLLEMVRQYIYLTVRTTFDPPNSSAVLNAFLEMIKQYEFRIQVACGKE